MIQGKICFVQTNFRHGHDITFATKNKFNSNIYNLWYLGAPACFRRFQKNILGGAILVYNRYSEESVCNLTKRRTLPPLFSGEIFKNGWHSPSGTFPRKHSWWNHFSIILLWTKRKTKRRTRPPRNVWKWMASYVFLCYEKYWLHSPD